MFQFSFLDGIRKKGLTVNTDLIIGDSVNMTVIKRKILSIALKVFNPIGFTSSWTLLPTFWLQNLWDDGIS